MQTKETETITTTIGKYNLPNRSIPKLGACTGREAAFDPQVALPIQNVISQEYESDKNDVNHIDRSGAHDWTNENPISIVPNNLRNNDVEPNYPQNPEEIYLPSGQKMLQTKTHSGLKSQQQREFDNTFRQKTPEPCVLPKENGGITEVVASLQECQNVACQPREISTASHADLNSDPQRIGSNPTQLSTSIPLLTQIELNQHFCNSQPNRSLSSNQSISIMNLQANDPQIHHRVRQNIPSAQSHTFFQPSHSSQHLINWKERESLNSLGVANNLPEIFGQNQQKASIKQNYCQSSNFAQQMLHPAGLHQQLPTTREQYVQPNICTNPQQSSSENVNDLQQPIHNGNNPNQQTAHPLYSDSYHHQPFFRNNYRSVKLSDIRIQKFDADPLKWNEWSCLFS